MFEDLVSLISKTAFPGGSGGSKGLGPLHTTSLEALIAVLQALSERLDDPPPQLQPATALDHFVDVWGPICHGRNPPLDQILGNQAAEAMTAAAASTAAAAGKPLRDSASSGGYSTHGSGLAAALGSSELRQIASSNASSSGNLFGKSRSCGRFDQALPEQELSGYDAAIAAETAAFEKGLKQRVMLAVDHFNKDYKKGFQFLQV
jgi:brefeldin A-resistance guanine nucleotide exchange factor 1